MLGIEKKHIPMLLLNACVIIFFGLQFISALNYEFLIYLLSVLIFAGFIIYSNQYVKYSMPLLYLLSIGIFIHLAGGGVIVNGEVLYESMLFPISETYNLIRYDQIAHGFGFFTATILAYEIIRNQLKTIKLNIGMLVILSMAGCGFGALNEVIEFIVDQSVPHSGVGGYINTSVDLVVNLIGSIAGVAFIKVFLEKKST